MTTNESLSRESHGSANLRVEVQSLRKMMAIVVVICLVISACFNVYVVRVNLALRERVAKLDKARTGYVKMHQFLQRLVRDLRVLSKGDSAVADLLLKYESGFPRFGVDSQARGAPLR